MNLTGFSYFLEHLFLFLTQPLCKTSHGAAPLIPTNTSTALYPFNNIITVHQAGLSAAPVKTNNNVNHHVLDVIFGKE